MNRLPETRALPISVRYAAIIHSRMAADYVDFNRMADSFDRHGSPVTSPVEVNAAEVFRDEADACRFVGQSIEVLFPSLDAANWRWPQ